MRSSTLTPLQKLGIIAGGGNLPEKLVAACDKKGIEVFIIAIEGHTEPQVYSGRHYMMTRLGAGGQMIETLRAHDIKDIVLIGGVRRPSLMEMKPDMWTAKFFAKVGLKSFGDNGILTALDNALRDEGFTVHGVQDFVHDLLAPAGLIGKHKPEKENHADIERGLLIARELGSLDVGQSVIIQEGLVLGVEGVEGTDELIRRCSAYKRKGQGGILVKACKPQQDRNLDLPTIGPQTVITCIEAGLAGIVIEAGQSLLLEPEKVAELADMNKIFVLSVEPGKTL